MMEENKVKNLILESSDIRLDSLKSEIKDEYFALKTKKKFPWKLTLSVMTPTLAAAVIGFILVPTLSSSSFINFDSLPTYESVEGDVDTIKNANSDSLFAYSAITSIGMFDTVAPDVSNQIFKAYGGGDINEDLNSEIIDEIKGYLPTAEAALLGEEVLTESQYVESDKEEYTIKLVISYTDLSLNVQEIVMYYNETVIEDVAPHTEEEDPIEDVSEDTLTTETSEVPPLGEDEFPPHEGDEPPHDSDKPPHDDDEPPHEGDKPPHDDDEPPHEGDKPPHDDDEPPHDGDKPPHGEPGHRPGDYDREDKYEFSMEGILIYEGNEYPMEGERVSDDDEMEIRLRYHLSDVEYVEVKQEIEEDEIEFEYTCFNNNKPLNSYTLEVKHDHILELKYRSENIEDRMSLLFFLFQDKDGDIYIGCEYMKERERYHVLFHKDEDGEYSVIDHQHKNKRD